jgi:hypothetical protein
MGEQRNGAGHAKIKTNEEQFRSRKLLIIKYMRRGVVRGTMRNKSREPFRGLTSVYCRERGNRVLIQHRMKKGQRTAIPCQHDYRIYVLVCQGRWIDRTGLSQRKQREEQGKRSRKYFMGGSVDAAKEVDVPAHDGDGGYEHEPDIGNWKVTEHTHTNGEEGKPSEGKEGEDGAQAEVERQLHIVPAEQEEKRGTEGRQEDDKPDGVPTGEVGAVQVREVGKAGSQEGKDSPSVYEEDALPDLKIMFEFFIIHV